ncbi:hypothetical protein FRB95_003283 [Tulasnella sp. JGI-2019a]|nr:hypothetical protein FRB95_003283 [Tulasnella sp. JGI-2019a]
MEFAKGMAVMVTYNVQTDLDVVNGSQGMIVNIILDKREPSIAEGVSEVQLKYQPAYLLVKMDWTKAERLDRLEDSMLPLVQLTRTFQISMTDGKSKTVNRTQLPLTAAYTFTNMQSQGQTIPYVIVDIAAPLTGGLTPFNTYVTLSQSLGRDTI